MKIIRPSENQLKWYLWLFHMNHQDFPNIARLNPSGNIKGRLKKFSDGLSHYSNQASNSRQRFT